MSFQAEFNYEFTEINCPKCGEPKDLEGIFEDNHNPKSFTISCDICDFDMGRVEAIINVSFKVTPNEEPK